MPEYSVAKIGSENFNVLIPLMKDCFGMDVNIEYFQWKYIQNPAGSFIGFIAIENETNEVGAYYGVIPQRFMVNGVEKIIYQSCDTMTHSNHRRRGLFKMLAEECYRFLREKNSLFVIGFGGAQSTPGFLKFGWQHIFNFKYFVKPAILCKLDLVKAHNRENFVEIKNPEELEDFFKKLNNTSNVIISGRTATHMIWRVHNPNYFYNTIAYKKNEITEGYVIFYIQKNKLILFDFAFLSKDAEKALCGFLSRQVNEHKYKGVIAFCQEGGRQAIVLGKNGFICNPFKGGPLSEKTPFIFFADDLELKEFSSPAKWEITGYDHDAL